jgi:hypothetical protein
VFEALDLDHDGKINFREFVMVTHILSDGSDDEKIDCTRRLVFVCCCPVVLYPWAHALLACVFFSSLRCVIPPFSEASIALFMFGPLLPLVFLTSRSLDLFNLYDKDSKGKLTPAQVAELVASSAVHNMLKKPSFFDATNL